MKHPHSGKQQEGDAWLEYMHIIINTELHVLIIQRKNSLADAAWALRRAGLGLLRLWHRGGDPKNASPSQSYSFFVSSFTLSPSLFLSLVVLKTTQTHWHMSQYSSKHCWLLPDRVGGCVNTQVSSLWKKTRLTCSSHCPSVSPPPRFPFHRGSWLSDLGPAFLKLLGKLSFYRKKKTMAIKCYFVIYFLPFYNWP